MSDQNTKIQVSPVELPAGYEDAQIVQGNKTPDGTDASGVQLPVGYEGSQINLGNKQAEQPKSPTSDSAVTRDAVQHSGVRVVVLQAPAGLPEVVEEERKPLLKPAWIESNPFRRAVFLPAFTAAPNLKNS